MGIQGKTVVFTGKISKPRHEFQKIVKEHGGIPGNDITSKTDYLVVGEKPGSKLVRASILGVKMLSEEEFLNLLKEEVAEEEPLTDEELKGIEECLITLTCSYCKRQYRQWAFLPDYETCPVCEITSNVTCPHCNNEPIFVTDFGLYHCMLCGNWFRGPYSVRARKVKHIHLFLEVKKTPNGILKQCSACGHPVLLPSNCYETQEEKYRKAPEWIKERKLQKEKEQEVLKYLESLTPAQLELLNDQI